MKKILKCGGHCYDSCGWFECDFWQHKKDQQSRCALFNAEKPASESLVICNIVYGTNYNGDVQCRAIGGRKGRWMITIPDAMRRPAEVERDELKKQLADALAEIESLKLSVGELKGRIRKGQ